MEGFSKKLEKKKKEVSAPNDVDLEFGSHMK